MSGSAASAAPDSRPGRRGEAGHADPLASAREICLHQLAARPRSRAELAAVMRRRGVEEDVAERVLDRLVEVGLVDDEAFAAAFVSSARAGRGLGRRALAVELRRRGVEPEVSEAALASVEVEDEEETARALVARRLRAMGGLPEPVRVRRLVALLTRKGYPLDLVMRVVTEAVPATDGEDCDPDQLSG
ncbi:recombination regulator RecX [Frankia sp. EI5c]|uniref:recombination regulator RecX n=1 Tax=Frankia sp. EI5c TaxID=683316 RepID=UPI0037C1A398